MLELIIWLCIGSLACELILYYCRVDGTALRGFTNGSILIFRLCGTALGFITAVVAIALTIVIIGFFLVKLVRSFTKIKDWLDASYLGEKK